ncbi:hypothetical protein DPMN_030541 [Dreissena polymorpha]|uniref:Uncharacterized protein n=1 Tax=Dreissena polymorpha TaxID=45954 RepID=A0A9D4M053_DREPO|nr:hypothetical protein DPMN_030541 [Dreissena polymorpha]
MAVWAEFSTVKDLWPGFSRLLVRQDSPWRRIKIRQQPCQRKDTPLQLLKICEVTSFQTLVRSCLCIKRLYKRAWNDKNDAILKVGSHKPHIRGWRVRCYNPLCGRVGLSFIQPFEMP